MIVKRPSSARGHANHGWLDTYHTFSFADYQDARHMGFRDLRVINEDRVAPGEGFGTHPHRDMEILTVVMEGALEHKDSMGSGGVIRPGEVQYMSAGTGVTHSEFNASKTEPVHLFQVWILPERRGLAPTYAQRAFPREERRGKLRLLASRDGREGALAIRQDVELMGGLLEGGEKVAHALRPGRHAWVQVARGAVKVNGVGLGTGDGAAVSKEEKVEIEGVEPAEVLFFDLA